MMNTSKKCMVCGDKALGYNFNAVTCESCKAFFRRNALAKKQFSCPFNQNCEITLVTRRFCQRCRLKKCLDIGMKSENIMSEQDKLIKRRKIETNREKRKEEAINEVKYDGGNVTSEVTKIGLNESCDSQSCGSFDSSMCAISSDVGVSSPSPSSTSCPPMSIEPSAENMTSAEIVDFIIGDPERSTQAINKLMRSAKEALLTLEKVINSQSEALRLISHLISYPGDALKIISKIMNSPLNALTVFTKFMSSPTDALEIISKTVDSPQDVLLFVKQLMDSPEDALDIMNKFMNTPAEALRLINKMVKSYNNANATEQPTEEKKVSTAAVTFTPAPLSNGICVGNHLSNSPTAANVETLEGDFSHQKTTSVVRPSSTSSPCNIPYGLTTNIASLETATTAEVHSSPPPPPPTPPPPPPPPPTYTDYNYNAENFDYHHNMFCGGSGSGSPYAYHPSAIDGFQSLDSVLSEVIRIEYEAFNALPPESEIKLEHHTPLAQQHREFLTPPQQMPSVVCSSSSIAITRDLNGAELAKLRELKIASEALYYPVDEDLNELVVDVVRIKPEDTQQDPKLLQVINLTAVAIKRLIKMAKKITAFRDMCQEDQVALLKGGCTEMMIMRSVMTYDDNRNTWKIPHTKEDMSNIRAEVLKLAKGNVYEEHLRFIRTFDEKWRMDENIILIMCAIVLFTPNRSCIIHSDVIRLEQNTYYYLLRRYLESIYSGCEARSAYIKLMQKISDVERLNQFIIGVYLNVNPSLVEPLLREIFDLKNH